MRRACFVLALLALALTASGPAAGKAPGDKHGHIPGDALWDYGAWADDYLVIATAYDPEHRQVTWTLEARKKVTARRYRARFTDPDLLEMDLRDITFTPAQSEYRKGSHIKATMKLPDKEVMQEVNRVTVGSAE
jgi:hypothetical protein